MAAPPSHLPPSLPDDLIEEILLRLPPDDPACFLRASLVCKAWGCAISRPSFRRRLHDLHRAPPVLGFLHDLDDEDIPHFIPTDASSFSLAAPDRQFWRALDCRHGRALFLSKGKGTQELLVWEPITGAQQRIPLVPAAFEGDWPTAAVFCAVDGCDHRDCLGGPFRVVFLFCVDEEDADQDPYLTSACVYSSETGTWGELTSMHGEFVMYFNYFSSLLVGRSLFYFLSDGGWILEYDLARHGLAVFDTPDCYISNSGSDYRFNLMLAEGGGLGVSEELGQRLKLWSREVSDGADARWVSRVINLKILFPNDALADATSSVQVLGYAEEANVIFVTTDAGLFSIELQSERARKVCDDHGFYNLIPVVSFYTPHSRLQALGGEHHDPPPRLNPTHGMGGQQGGSRGEITRVGTGAVL